MEHGADFTDGFFYAASMRSCTGLYLHGDVIFAAEAGKTRRAYHVQGDICQAFHNYAAMSYICWQDENKMWDNPTPDF